MEIETAEKTVEQYLTLLGKIKARTGDDRTALTILQEVSKDMRMAQVREERENGYGHGSNQSDDAEATERQCAYLRRLGVEIPEGLTKKEASALIDEALAKESDEDSPAPLAANTQIPWQCVTWEQEPLEAPVQLS